MEARAVTSQVDEKLDLIALFRDASETLMSLPAIPDAHKAGVSLRQFSISKLTLELEMLTESLTRIHRHLLVESNPDYWVDQITIPSEIWDSSLMDITVAVTDARQRQAQLIASVIRHIDCNPSMDSTHPDTI
jgi:hypothetical protein